MTRNFQSFPRSIQFFNQNARYILFGIGGIFLALLTACETAEQKVVANGSVSPRNHREKVIFDYYNALKQKRYQDAYKLRSPSAAGAYHFFIQDETEHHAALPVRISIGEEEKISGADQDCGYVYIVYVADPGETTLISGEVSMEPNREKPGSCQIGYNSAFGSHP